MDLDRPLLIHGGRVFTADVARPWADALAVRASRIAGVGTAAELADRFSGASEIDVEGRTVLPGLTDAHNHFLATGESLASSDARYPGIASVEHLVGRLREAAALAPPGAWITASGFDDAEYDWVLTRWDLDRATSAHPVMVLHVSGHHVFVNSEALERRGVSEDTPDPQGGRLVRGPDGRLSGLCLDAAMNLILPVAVDIGAHGPNFHTETTLEASDSSTGTAPTGSSRAPCIGRRGSCGR